MASLIYSVITSLDGYVADERGAFDWAAPDEEVHAFVNDLERRVGTYLYGRRLYEVMRAWETLDTKNEPGVVRDFAQIWRAADKIVFSRTLDAAVSGKTRIERAFAPDEIRAMKIASDRDISVGGPALAAQAITAGLVDEYRQFIAPVIVGGGAHWLPRGTRADLDFVEQRRFASGVVYLRYRAR
ncbi:MAG TPA: dihydrofolate reductase family protein [Candidatus Baltobacteraceae bacterium]|nr:dihydrofolate reductase family protein [Candidatus Baltobacteraceae bacterium]